MIRRACFLLLLAVAAPARGDDHGDAAQHFKTGRELARAGDHRGAIAEFEAASRAVPVPNVLYNLAHEYGTFGLAGSADDARRAIASYRRYLELRPDAKDRAEVEGFVAALRRVAGPDAPAAPEVKPLPPVVAAPLSPPPVVPPPIAPPILVPPPLVATPVAAPPTVTPPVVIAPPAVAASFDGLRTNGLVGGDALAAPSSPPSPRPIYRRWYVWAAVGAAVLAGGAVALDLALTPHDAQQPPSDYGALQVHF